MQARINQANGWLKNRGVRIRIEQIGDLLYLQATLLPKLSSSETKPHQQRIVLGISANSSMLPENSPS